MLGDSLIVAWSFGEHELAIEGSGFGDDGSAEEQKQPHMNEKKRNLTEAPGEGEALFVEQWF